MSIFPMIQPIVDETNEVQTLPLAREVAWDYENDVPVYRRGEPVTVTGKEAVKVWIWNAIHTERYRYMIYSGAYGSEFHSLIGKAYTPNLKTAEAPRYLRECLLVNPYITAVNNITVEFADARLTVQGAAETVYGEVPIYAAL